MPVGRLFTEIGKEVDRMNASLRQAVTTAQEAGIKVTGSGQAILARFQDAINPTKKLGEQIELLTKAGAKNAEVWTYMGKEIKSAMDTAKTNGQAIDATVKKLFDVNAGAQKAGMGIEDLGRSMISFARSPIATAQTAMTGLLEKMGPLAVGIGGIAAAAVAGGAALFKLGMDAAQTMERLQNLAVQTGLTVEQLQALEQIGKEAGLDINLGRSLGMLNRQLEQGGEFVKVLNSLRYAAGQGAIDIDQGIIPVLDDLRKRILAIESPTQQARLANAAFGRGLREMIPIILDGTASLEQRIQAQKEAGTTWDAETQQKLLAFDKGLDMLGRTWNALAVSVKGAIGSMLGDLASLGQAQEDATQTARQLYEQWAKDPKTQLPKFEKGFFNVIMGDAADPLRQMDQVLARAKAIAENKKYDIELTIRLAETQQRFADAVRDADGKRAMALAREIAGIKEAIAANEEQRKKYEQSKKDLIKILSDYLTQENKAVLDSTADVMTALYAQLAEFERNLKPFSLKARGIIDTQELATIDRLLAPVNNKLGEFRTAADEADAAGSRMARTWMTEVSTVFTDLSRDIADSLVKSQAMIADFARATVRIFVQELLRPLQALISDFVGQLMSLLGGGGFNWGGIAGGTSLWNNLKRIGATIGGGLGLAGGAFAAGGTAAALTGPSVGALGTSPLMGGTMGTALLPSLGGVPVGTATIGSPMAGGSGFMGAMGAFMTNPWTIGIGAALGAGYALYKAFTQDAYEAGGKEVLRDLNVQISQGNWKAFTKGLGLTEKQLYPIRLDIEMSPKFLTEVAWPLAVQQGKIDEFLGKLEEVNTVMGKLDLATPFREFLETGEVDALNKAYTDLFQNSKALLAVMPDFAAKLAAIADPALRAAYALKLQADSFAALRESIKQLIPVTKDIYQIFLETGKITDELASKITEFGGDLRRFQDLAGLIALNTQFGTLVEHFRATGEILPELGDIITQFGGDLAVVQTAATQLQTLQVSLSSITDLVQGINQILPEKGPIQQILSGEWGAGTWAGLEALNIDPAKLTKITDLIKFETGWEDAVAQFRQTGKLIKGGILEQALWQFGGAGGATALQRYGQGFNTITPVLLEATKSAMDAAYKAERQTVLDYLTSLSESTTEAINAAQATINEQLDLVGANITTAIEKAALDVIGEIDKILAAIQAQIASPPGTPQTVTGEGTTIPEPEPPGSGEGFEQNIRQPSAKSGLTINVIANGPIIAENVDRLISESIRRGMRRGDFAFLASQA